jgi:tetratricopeptide (TPR) repeat protein
VLLQDRLESLGRHPRLRPRARAADLAGLAAGVGGSVGENAAGEFVLIEELLPLPPRAAWSGVPAWLFGDGAAPPEPGLCFFDTETTGLSGGVGNQVFLMAMAWRVGGGLLMRQYLLPDPAFEQPFLEAISLDLDRSAAMVSYNGRSFDAPVLTGRLLMSRRSPGCLLKPHLDLLHPVRRIFKARLGSCTLQNVEALVLGRDRGDDIPGYLIPEMYFAYLRSHDPELLRSVVAHNRQDVVSLSLLLDHLLGLPDSGTAAHPLDRFGLARVLESCGQVERAIAIYDQLWDEADCAWDGEVWPGAWTPVELAYVLGLRLAVALRRHGLLERAEAVVEAAWRRYPRPWEAGIMLAKILEHRRKDRSAAIEVVSAALEALQESGSRNPSEERWLVDLRKRHARLEGKRAAEAA